MMMRCVNDVRLFIALVLCVAIAGGCSQYGITGPASSNIGGSHSQFYVRVDNVADLCWRSSDPLHVFATPMGNSHQFVELRRFLALAHRDAVSGRDGVSRIALQPALGGLCWPIDVWDTTLECGTSEVLPFVVDMAGRQMGSDGGQVPLTQSGTSGWNRYDVHPLVPRFASVPNDAGSILSNMHFVIVKCEYEHGCRVISFDNNVIANMLAHQRMDPAILSCAVFLSIEAVCEEKVVGGGSCVVWCFRQVGEASWRIDAPPMVSIDSDLLELRGRSLRIFLADSSEAASQFVSTSVKVFTQGTTEVAYVYGTEETDVAEE